MLTKLFSFLDPSLVEPDQPPKLQKLAADVDHLQHSAVDACALREAPVIGQSAVMPTLAGVGLARQFTKHPLLGSHPAPAAWLGGADPEPISVRTTSRFYRLGDPADAASREVLQSVFDIYRERDDSSEDRS